MARDTLSDGTPPRGNPLGVLRDLKLAWQLFRDHRVPVRTKAIPVLSLVYLIWPIDLLPDPILGLGQLDDLGVILLGIKLFVGLCPHAVVRQYQTGAADHLVGSETQDGNPSSDEVIDTTYRVLEDTRPESRG